MVRALLGDLAARGIELCLVADRIRYRPRSAMTPDIASRLLDVRDQLALELDARSDPFTASVLDLGDREVVPEAERGEVAPFTEPPRDRAACPGCRGRLWWGLRSGGPQVCSRCHPCGYADDQVERWEVAP